MAEVTATETQIRHVSINPMLSYESIGQTCRSMEASGYALIRSVPISDYEIIIVFEKVADG